MAEGVVTEGISLGERRDSGRGAEEVGVVVCQEDNVDDFDDGKDGSPSEFEPYWDGTLGR